MARKKELEFNSAIKYEAKKRAGYKCEVCGKKTDLECHHLLPVALAKFYPEISYTVIASLANCVVLCHECHRKADKEAVTNHRKTARKLKRKYGTQGRLDF